MDILQCKHLRVRDSNDYSMDIEKFIKSLEAQFNIDFKTLPQWKELIEVMNIVQTEFKQKVQNAKNRKFQILRDIFIQNSRLSPFELTDKFARTSKLWQDIEFKIKNRQVFKIRDEQLSVSNDGLNVIQELVGEVSDNESKAHPNTEVIQSNDFLDMKPDTEQEFKSSSSPLLPVVICTNQHKIISPMGSDYTPLRNQEFQSKVYELNADTIQEGSLLLTQTAQVKYYPDKIIIKNNSSNKQSVKLYFTNRSTEYLHIRFKRISDSLYFKNIKILPCTPIKLYPGLAVVLKFIYSLENIDKESVISSLLQFRIGHNVLFHAIEEILSIPIVSKFVKWGNIAVSETVSIPPVYSWHVTPKFGYPKAVVHIQNNDDKGYYLHIRKKIVDFNKEPDESIKSEEVITPDSESLVQKIEDNEIENQSKILTTSNVKQIRNTYLDESNMVNDSINTVDIVGLVLNDLIDISLEPFIFKQTYLRILPRSRRVVFVYLTKVHHVGYHQSYYDFVFSDIKNDDIILTKPIKVFAEVRPHPVIIQPKILDMSNSPVTYGYWKDHFIIINTHKIYPVTIKITTTTKMKKLFKIVPMETLIRPQSRENFEVKMCLQNTKKPSETDDLAYFIIKIQIFGHKSIYQNVPPVFYEIIAPCATEFKQVYGKKYFTDIVDTSEIISSDIISSCEHLYKYS